MIPPRTEVWRSTAIAWSGLVSEQWEPIVSTKWVTYNESDLATGADPEKYYYFNLPYYAYASELDGEPELGPAFPWTRLRVLKHLVGGPYKSLQDMLVSPLDKSRKAL